MWLQIWDTRDLRYAIQGNDGTLKVPVEIFIYDTSIPGSAIWRGIMGDNLNTLGSKRTFENIIPNITIGPDDALIFTSPLVGTAASEMQLNVRGFYQQQPA